MGAYVYTVRNKTKNVNGQEFASYEYAYKPSTWGGDKRNVAIKEAHAVRSFDKLLERGVKYAIHGEWSWVSAGDKVAFVEINDSSYYDTQLGNRVKVVGYISKVNGKYIVEYA